jgi:competence protein ComEA
MPDLTKEQLYIILGIIAVILIGCVIGLYNQNIQNISASQSSLKASPEPQPDNKPKTQAQTAVFVHISGAVVREGVYKLNRGDRLIDLIRLSGAASNADLDSVNLAEVLTDGQKVFIPQKTLRIAADNVMSTAKGSNNGSKIVNINTADEKGMDSLPGIGPVMAKRIVDYRRENGRFSNIEELKEVPGISEKKFDNLKKYISVN